MEKSHLEKFQEQKKSNMALSNALKEIDPVESKRLRDCCNWYTERMGLNIQTNERIIKKDINHTCKSKYCVICEKRKNSLYFQNMMENIVELPKEYGIMFMTLTVENCKLTDLKKTLKIMSESQNRMRGRLNTYLMGRKKKQLGYFGCTEITYLNKNGTKKIVNGEQMAHPHKHLEIVVPMEKLREKSISQKELTRMWNECLQGEMKGFVDIRTTNGDISSLKELIKYTTKHTEYIDLKEEFREIKNQLKGFQMYQSSGYFKCNMTKFKEKMKLEKLELEMENENVITDIIEYKRIFLEERGYYKIYDIKWLRELSNREKKNELFHLYKLGRLHSAELEYVIKTQDLGIDEPSDTFERIFDQYTNKVVYREKEIISKEKEDFSKKVENTKLKISKHFKLDNEEITKYELEDTESQNIEIFDLNGDLFEVISKKQYEDIYNDYKDTYDFNYGKDNYNRMKTYGTPISKSLERIALVLKW
jgi:hypothetical protein